MSGKPEDARPSDGIELLVAAATLQDLRAAERRRILPSLQPAGTLNKENDQLKSQPRPVAMDLRKSTTPVRQEAATALPSPLEAQLPSTTRVSAFTPTNGHPISLPGTPTGTNPLSHFRFGLPNPDPGLAHGRHLPDVSAAYNAIATANLLASLAANNQSVASYFCGLGSPGPLPFNMPPRFPPMSSPVFPPSTANPVLKELISASRQPANHDHRRQSPDTTTGREPISTDMLQARALRDSLIQKSAVPSPDSGTVQPPSISGLSAETIMPPLNLNQLSVEVPPVSGGVSGPNSVSSIAAGSGDKTKDGRYLERRKRNNEAAKRCRANRRALFEYRFKRSQELELENSDLKCQITKLRLELANLQELVRKSGLHVETSHPAEPPQPHQPPQLPHRADEAHESGHESDFSSCGEPKKTESIGSYASSSPESGVSSPGHALATVATEEHE